MNKAPCFSYKNMDRSKRSFRDESLYFRADDYFFSLIDDLKKAESSIKIESYIFEYNYLGRMIIKELVRATKRGVKCYLLIDGIGSCQITNRHLKFFRALGIEVKVFNPLPWQIEWSGQSFLEQCLKLLVSLYSINKRNHRKLAVIDKEISYIGSFNISDVHLQRINGTHAWQDCGLKVAGQSVITLNKAFQVAWNTPINPHVFGLSTVYGPHKKIKDALVRLNYNLKWRTYFQRDLLKRIRLAQKRIWITNPYFVPDISITNQLKLASNRGVDVRVLVPKKCDLKLFPYINSLFYRGLMKNKIRVYEYLPRVLHEKTMIIDEWMILGSSNLNSRSHKHDLEVDIVVTGKEQRRYLEQEYICKLEVSEELSYNDVLKRYRYDYFKTSFIQLIKYWL